MRIVATLLTLTPALMAAPGGGGANEASGFEYESLEHVAVRVNMAGTGAVLVDRGVGTGIEQGDLVVFYPVGDASQEGTIVFVDDRSATVELHDPQASLQVGTKGEVIVPAARFAVEAEAYAPQIPAHTPWEFDNESWNPDMPLLAQVEAVSPEERARQFSGRMYVLLDQTWNNENDRQDSFFRVGTDLLYENPFGRGGGLHVDGELNYRRVQLPDSRDEDEARLRVDRLSYYRGGTRFSPQRWEVGRFLQSGMPEFGVVDGGEYGYRLENGDSWGVAAGFMPEPNSDFETGDDFQTAAYYHHVMGENDELTLDGGFQKTWHNGRADRDLAVAKVRYLPGSGWTFHGTAWVDLYTSSDQAKGAGPEVTQLSASAGYRWDNGDGVNVSYTHLRFPELRRNEFQPITMQELADNRTDRLSVSGWHRMSDDLRLSGRLNAWNDEDATGGGGEVRVDKDDLFFDRSRASAAIFVSEGQFSSVVGTRLSVSRLTNTGSWDLSWEVANHQQDDFSGNQENLLQHRLRASYDMRTQSGWNWSVYAEDRFGDEQGSLSVGVFMQKSF